ncbi:MAG: S4 domain-containing protein, partial [Gammaproteobacteria bacterium]
MSAPHEPRPTPADSQKLQKVIAASGRGSRRQIEAWIAAGRVQVNGQAAHLGQRVNPSDEIAVDGTVIETGGAHVPQVLVLNKAAGLVCS